ncbi:sensor histidine kinase [Rugamonas sp.]|uniref:sensor histidine kinase n=1 Tax=Rugamonas sp. TaxID=1926287 RepID=UPI0025E8BEC1|nr:sensor histidine kinase [Rugamonas sp.]
MWPFAWLGVRVGVLRADERMRVRQSERERIARALHDTLLQNIQGLLLRFHSVSVGLPDDSEAQAALRQILDRADEVMVESRRQIMALRMTTAGGADLNGALAAAGRSLQESFGTPFELRAGTAPAELDGTRAEEIYYIAREALCNAFRHARAGTIVLELEYGAGRFTLSVRDDGVGIAAPVLQAGGRPGHWGLVGMRERSCAIGGALAVDSAPGQGTRVTLTVPAGLLYRQAGQCGRPPRPP